MADEEQVGPVEAHTLLFVDDEQNILNALRRIFRKEPHRILTATSGREGLALLKEHPVSLVISDHRMPEMEGTAFLSQVMAQKPDTVRILLTGYADIKAAMEAINRCQVFRFIAKPWDDEDLRLTVRQGLRQHELVALNRELTELVKQQNQELYDMNRNLESKIRERTCELEEKNRELSGLYQRLEASFLDTIRAFVGLMELRDPTLVGHTRRVANLAREVASHLGQSEEAQRVCEISALLMDVGTIGFPDHLLRKREEEMDQTGRTLWMKHPLLGESCLKGIDMLKPVALAIRAHHERFDGKGFPDGLRKDGIPLAARIVAAADYFDQRVNLPAILDRVSVLNARTLLENEQGLRFDPVVVQALLDVIEKTVRPTAPDEAEIPLGALREGMVLARDLKTRGGILLIPAGSILKMAHLQKLRSFQGADPIVDPVFIHRRL